MLNEGREVEENKIQQKITQIYVDQISSIKELQSKIFTPQVGYN